MDVVPNDTMYPTVLDCTRCFICSSKDNPLFSFPQDQDQVKLWLQLLGVNNNLDYDLKFFQNNARICAIHFDENAFTSSERKVLLQTALPKIHPMQPSPLQFGLSNEGNTQESLKPATPISFLSHEVQSCKNLSHIKSKLGKDADDYPSVLRAINSKLWKNGKKKKTLLGTLFCTLTVDQYVFVLDIKGNSLKLSKNRRWSKEEKSMAIEISNESPSTYKLLRKYLGFPSISTFKRYSFNVFKSPGICPNFMLLLQKHVRKMKLENRFCVLTFDEIPLKRGLSYNFKSDVIDGFESFPNDDPQPASKALVFMLRGISENWKQVLGYFFLTEKERNTERKTFLLEALEKVDSCGLRVIAVTCNHDAPNQALMKELNVSTDDPFFSFKGSKVFVIWDPPHLLTLVRNDLKNHCISFWNHREKKTGFAWWKYILQLFEFESLHCSEHRVTKLARENLEVSTMEEMNNLTFAAEVLHYKVAGCICLLITSPAKKMDAEAMQTADFVANMSKIFDSVNSRKIRPDIPGHGGAVKRASGHVEFWSSMLEFIESWQIESADGKVIAAPSQKGWIVTLKAFIGIWEVLKAVDFKHLLLNRFNLYFLRQTLLSLKEQQSFQSNPDCKHFSEAMQREVLLNSLIRNPVDLIFEEEEDDDDGGHNLLNFVELNSRTLSTIIDEESDNFYVIGKYVIPEVNSMDENVLLYISAYMSKKYCERICCYECETLLMCAKPLNPTTLHLCFKESVDYNLKWPVESLTGYVLNLYEVFLLYFHFQDKGVKRKVKDKLLGVNFDVYEKHIKHRKKAQILFIEMFVNIMIKHKISEFNQLCKT